ncbi:hypothetical protein B0H14DRAFT_1475983 [Mycena olivaceomarginata]|nr:hypothetical protein B0H14DRAFT_1475983 [Mycena olivaceomarginata]
MCDPPSVLSSWIADDFRHKFSAPSLPSLEELLIRTVHPYSDLAPTILSFLDRPRCPLTSLSLGIPLALDELLSILESPSARAIVHLDISDEEVPPPIGTLCVNILAKRDILPNLRVLKFKSNAELKESAVLAMVARRRPVLCERRITGWWHHPVSDLIVLIPARWFWDRTGRVPV